MKNNKGQDAPLWGGRFEESVETAVIDYTTSLQVDQRLAFQDIRGTRAHVQMLEAQGILPGADLDTILKALARIEEELENGTFPFQPELEDIHMNIEARLTQLAGPPGARVHSGRSRNDQVAVDVKLYCRETAIGWQHLLVKLQESFLARGGALTEELFPAWTHMQVAQPISWAHYLLSFCAMFGRDFQRLESYRTLHSTSPLGAGALAGTTLPIDPAATAEALGFERSFLNSYDIAGDRDFVLELLQIASQLMLHVSRLAEDMIYLSSSAVGWVELPQSLCTGSSMMPQKQNPDILELARGRTASVLGHTQAVSTLLKGLPTSYHRDLQEDKPHLFSVVDIVESTLRILPRVIEGFSLIPARYEHLLKDGFLAATDLAEYLVENGVPFREAHRRVGELVSSCESEGGSLRELSLEDLQEWSPECTEEVLGRLDPESSLRTRNHAGATGVSAVEQQIEYWQSWLAQSLAHLAQIEENA